MSGPLAHMLAQKSVLLLDGAMGTELQRRGVDTGLPLWSANALVVHPETVLEIHREYIAAGVDIITTNTFRTTRRTMRRAKLPDRARQLTGQAIELAKQARASFPQKEILVAGSVAPLEDCYRPDLVPSDRELEGEHAELAGWLAEGGVDMILIETMNTMREAYAACAAAGATGKEMIVSFICRQDGALYGGDPLEEAVKSIEQLHPAAFSINCVSPRHIGRAMAILKVSTTLPFGVYANVGMPESQKRGWEFTHDVLEEEYALFAQEWRRNGASIIGGCCGTTPAYIRAVSKALTV